MAAGEPRGFGDPRHLGLGSAGLPWDLEEDGAWAPVPTCWVAKSLVPSGLRFLRG